MANQRNIENRWDISMSENGHFQGFRKHSGAGLEPMGFLQRVEKSRASQKWEIRLTVHFNTNKEFRQISCRLLKIHVFTSYRPFLSLRRLSKQGKTFTSLIENNMNSGTYQSVCYYWNISSIEKDEQKEEKRMNLHGLNVIRPFLRKRWVQWEIYFDYLVW